MASYMDNEAIVDKTFDEEARDRPPANKQKGKRKRKIPPKSAEFVQDSDIETSIEAIKPNLIDKAEAAANEQYNEHADDGADLQDFIEQDETPKKIKSTPTAEETRTTSGTLQEMPAH